MRVTVTLLLLAALLVPAAGAEDADTPETFHGGARVISSYAPRVTTGGFFTKLQPSTWGTFGRVYVLRLIDVGVLAPYLGQTIDVETRAAVTYGRIEIEVAGSFWIELQPASPEVAEFFEDGGDSTDTRLRRLTFTPLEAESIRLTLENCPCPPLP